MISLPIRMPAAVRRPLDFRHCSTDVGERGAKSSSPTGRGTRPDDERVTGPLGFVIFPVLAVAHDREPRARRATRREWTHAA